LGRRWQPPKPATPQQQLILPPRGRFAPPVKLATDTSVAAADSLGIHRAGDLASALLPILERQTARTHLAGVMMAVEIRAKVFAWMREHPPATADEIANALGISILTIRPRVSELRRMDKICDAGMRRKNASGKSAIVWKIKEDAGWEPKAR